MTDEQLVKAKELLSIHAEFNRAHTLHSELSNELAGFISELVDEEERNRAAMDEWAGKEQKAHLTVGDIWPSVSEKVLIG